MVDDADFEFAIWAGGGNAVFPDEGRNHAPLDKIFVGIDMADERLAVTVFRRVGLIELGAQVAQQARDLTFFSSLLQPAANTL